MGNSEMEKKKELHRQQASTNNRWVEGNNKVVRIALICSFAFKDCKGAPLMYLISNFFRTISVLRVKRAFRDSTHLQHSNCCSSLI